MILKYVRIISAFFTLLGLILFIMGDWTNAFLSMIVGELVDLPERIEYHIKKLLPETKEDLTN